MKGRLTFVFLDLGDLTEYNIFHLYSYKFHIFTAEWYPIVYKYHTFLIHSVEGHVGCVYFLAVVNRVAINVVKHVFVDYSHLLSNNSS